MSATDMVADAARTAERFVMPLGRRWSHVQAVAQRALELERSVAVNDRPYLVAAAWLHDIGYSPLLSVTKFHPLDGARYLRSIEFPSRVVSLVAHHSCARFEAAERGLVGELAEFPLEAGPVMDALVAADMTIGPNGEPLEYPERLAEIYRRYPSDDPVHRAWRKAADELELCVERVTARLANC